MDHEDNKRRRRISEQEEAPLVGIAPPHLRSMILASLETGMRRCETNPHCSDRESTAASPRDLSTLAKTGLQGRDARVPAPVPTDQPPLAGSSSRVRVATRLSVVFAGSG